MDERTETLIRELSEKLGTTGEHLWGVLVRQAPISGVIDLMVMAAWIAVSVWAFRFIKSKTTESVNSNADWEDEGAGIAWAIWGVASVAIVIVIGVSLSGSISQIINPEYWALKQLLP